MLMFENGLLATFIPELLMVLAYLFCLVVPGLKTEKQPTNLTPKIIQTSTVQSAVVSGYKVSTYYFYTNNQAVETNTSFSDYPQFHKLTVFVNPIIFPLESQHQAHFSRPPPMV